MNRDGGGFGRGIFLTCGGTRDRDDNAS